MYDEAVAVVELNEAVFGANEAVLQLNINHGLLYIRRKLIYYARRMRCVRVAQCMHSTSCKLAFRF